MNEPLQTMRYSADALFLMIGAVMIFSMHAGFAFLEAGSDGYVITGPLSSAAGLEGSTK